MENQDIVAENEENKSGTLNRNTVGPKGIGGWLILPIIGLFASPVKYFFSFINDFYPYLNKEAWDQIDAIPYDVDPLFFKGFIIYELVGNTIFALIFPIVLLFYLFSKSSLFPKLMIFCFISNFLLLILDEATIYFLLPELYSSYETTNLKEIIRGFLGMCIWVPYFIVSKRVKNTFVK